jgi:deoxyribodipyrimidine photo-lyase
MFSTDRNAALARLANFVPRAGRFYADNRNNDEGEGLRKNVSMLSPYLRYRVISEEEVLRDVLARHSLQASEKFVQEVFWRAYFKGFLEARPAIWSNYLSELEKLPRNKWYLKAIAGETGIDCFDHWVKELIETGYLHNHARMWFASIWIFTLKLPWELGAAFMYDHLLDGDPASNTLSWRWVGGLHTKGKTYLARADNIAKYTSGRFEPQGLASVAMPLDEPPLPPVRGLVQALSDAPEGRFGLLVTQEDVSIEGVMANKPAAVMVGEAGEERASHVTEFVAGVLPSTHKRVSLHDHEGIRFWCTANDLPVVVTPYSPVGPTADAIAALQKALLVDGITVLQLRRRYDTLSWPHATKGFFAMKEKIPSILGKLGIGSSQAELF